MVKTGISRKGLAPWGGKVVCGINESGVRSQESGGKTRAEQGIEAVLKENPNIGIIAIGNAPTALIKTIDLLSNAERRAPNARPLVVGVPVGFVKAVESKALLARQDFPFITALGRKGGTPVAVAIVNALLKIANDGAEKK
jgi:precorrin-8X/cobalt-precorrin-8 methylmutase